MRHASPSLTAEDLNHLTADDEALRQWCETLGPAGFDRLFYRLLDCQLIPDDLTHEEWAAIVVPPLRRLASEQERIHAARSLSHVARCLETDPTGYVEFRRRFYEAAGRTQQSDLPLGDRLQIKGDVLREAIALDLHHPAVVLEASMARSYRAIGQLDRWETHIRAALQRARRFGASHMEAQLLGEIGAWHGEQDRPDSLVGYWKRALAVATESADLYQTARMHTFFGNRAAGQGHYTEAREHFEQAAAAYDRHARPWEGLRWHNEAIQFAIRLGAWRHAERLIQRAEIVARSSDRLDPLVQSQLRRLRGLRAEAASHVGNRDDALIIRQLLAEETQGTQPRWLGFQSRLAWAEELLLDGALEEAEARILEIEDESGLRHRGARQNAPAGDSPPMDYSESIATRCAALLAEIYIRQARWAEAEAEIQLLGNRSSAPADQPLSPKHRLLRARVALGAGNAEGLRSEVMLTLQELLHTTRQLDGSAESYLRLDGYLEFRNLIHDLLKDDVEDAYDFEMAWRALPSLFGSSVSPPNTDRFPTVRSVVRAWTQTVTDGSRPARNHILFVVQGERVLRFDRVAGQLTRTELPASTGRLQKLVREAVAHLSRDPQSDPVIPRDLAGSLTRLGALLLPATRPTSPLLLTPDSFLTEVPFVALGVRSADYSPWLTEVDVAQLRFRRVPSAVQTERRPPLIVAPSYGSSVRQRYPLLRELPGAHREARGVARRFPEARLLMGDRATRPALLRAAPGADCIYVAAHLVRDPEFPFDAFLPLADAGGHEWSHLDFSDIRSLDLRGTRLVVLAACASGQPYLDVASVPGLSAAFLDSGARATIHTRWRVRDDKTAEIMGDVLEQWKENGDPLNALRTAQRRAAATDLGWAHPFHWAAYDVELAWAP